MGKRKWRLESVHSRECCEEIHAGWRMLYEWIMLDFWNKRRFDNGKADEDRKQKKAVSEMIQL